MNALERQVLRLIGEDVTSPDVFTDDPAGMAQIRDSISEAMQEFAMLFGGYTQPVYIPLRKETTFYRINLRDGYMGWVKDAWSVNRRRQLRQTDVLELRGWDLRWMTYTGYPDRYVQYGLNTVAMVPKPSADSEVVMFNVVTIPKYYEHEDERIRLRNEFQDAVVSYAVAEYFASRGDARTATSYLERYLEVAAIRQRHQGSPGAHRQMDSWKQLAPAALEADGVR